LRWLELRHRRVSIFAASRMSSEQRDWCWMIRESHGRKEDLRENTKRAESLKTELMLLTGGGH
jgi:hypothetical protein